VQEKRTAGWRAARGACAASGLLLFGFLASPARADTWFIDKTASEVRFSYDHFGLSRQGGRFRDISGRLDFTPTDPESGRVEVAIKASAVSTGASELDQLLRSSDFFDAARHPVITFTSTQVRKTGEKTGQVTGNLTMLGVTMPVSLDVVWNFTGEYPLSSINPNYQGKWVSGFSGKTTILRSAWGMKRGIPLLSDEIELTLEAEFLRQDQ
jgi:polyisoprenoid-binding protein YceI